MSFKNGFSFQGTRLVDNKGEATPAFQALLTTLFQRVAIAESPQLPNPAVDSFPYVIPLPKLTGPGAAGSITIDYQGVVSAFTPPT